MRIAQIAPLAESVPPRLYGGTERVVSWLADELVALGHKVTLFASGQSRTKANLVPAWPQPLRLAGLHSREDEERRLLYVAITRARQLCVVSYAVKRTLFGRALPGVPSRFLADLPAGSALYTAPSLGGRKAEVQQLALF